MDSSGNQESVEDNAAADLEAAKEQLRAKDAHIKRLETELMNLRSQAIDSIFTADGDDPLHAVENLNSAYEMGLLAGRCDRTPRGFCSGFGLWVPPGPCTKVSQF